MVVAADDGVMPQTREHAEVLRALAVTNGVVAVTKADLADPGERPRRLRPRCRALLPLAAVPPETADLLPGPIVGQLTDGPPGAETGFAVVRRTMELNFFAQVRLTKALLPLLRRSVPSAVSPPVRR